MKKTLFGVAAALLTLTACSGNKTCDNKSACNTDKDLVYSGILPAADAEGVRYTLTLDYDDNGQKGDYDLNQAYLGADSLSTDGYKVLNSFKSEGDFMVETRDVDGKQVKYLRLVPDAKDSAGDTTTLYLLMPNDSTLTLVGSNLRPSEMPGMNYDLKLKK